MNVDTQTHLTTLRDLLTYRLTELRSELRADRAALAADDAPPAGEVNDAKDLADRAGRREVDEAQLARDLAEIESIEAALHRLDNGTYGDCTQCGEAIALQRLLVQPAAVRCAACQAAFERRHPVAESTLARAQPGS